MDVRALARAGALAGCAGATISLALAPRSLEVAILAATAGTLFEAAPVLLLASLLPARVRGLARSAGCGCGGPGALPGALAPVAVAVCWFSFGPAIAIARAVAAAIPVVIRRARARRAVATPATPTTPATPATSEVGKRATGPRRPASRNPPATVHCGSTSPARDDRPDTPETSEAPGDDTFATLWGLAACSAATALVAPHLGGLATAPGLAAVAGLALGALVPCATAGVALAAGSASRDPWLAAGVLATAGIVPRIRFPRPSADRAHAAAPFPAPSPDRRFAFALLALALATLALRGGAGLVNPRLVPLAALAAVVAVAVARGAGPAIHAGRRAAALPALMLAALIAGSPEPPYAADEAAAASGFPGEPLAFTGVAHVEDGTTRLVRFSITCCRLDATPLAVTLDRRLAVRDGTWLQVRGRFVLRDGRLVVHPNGAGGAIPVPRPPDPFVYR